MLYYCMHTQLFNKLRLPEGKQSFNYKFESSKEDKKTQHLAKSRRVSGKLPSSGLFIRK